MTNAMKVLCFLFLVAQVYSIYEDQVGEYEWQIENLGDINNIVFGSKIVATSQNGVIAAINHREGETEWRNILPEGSAVLKVVSDDDKVYTISKDSIIRAWLISDGSLVWDGSVLSSYAFNPITDMMIDGDSGHLVVLHMNCISYINKLNGKTVYQYCPFDENKNIILSHLTVPTSIFPRVHNTKFGNNIHAVSGCSIDDTSKDLLVSQSDLTTCRNWIVIDLSKVVINNNVKWSVFHIHSQPLSDELSLVNPFKMHRAIQQNFNGDANDKTLSSFHSDDSFCGIYKIEANDAYLACQQISTGAVATKVLSDIPTAAKTEWLDVLDHEIIAKNNILRTLPAIRFYHSYYTSQSKIFSLNLNIFAKDDKYSINVKDDDMCRNTLQMVENNPLMSSVGDSIICAQVVETDSAKVGNTCVDPKECSNNNLSFNEIVLAASNNELIRKANIPLVIDSSKSDISPSYYKESSFHKFFGIRHTKKGSGVYTLKVIGVGSTGNLYYFNSNKLKWYRDNRLSFSREAVIIDHGVMVEPIDKSLHHSLIPDFKTRLAMQSIELKQMASSAIDAITDIPHELQGAVMDILSSSIPSVSFRSSEEDRKRRQAVRRAADAEKFGFNKVSIHLISRCDYSGKHGDGAVQVPVSCLNSFEVVAIDLVEGKTLWSFQPNLMLDSSTYSEVKLWVKLLKLRTVPAQVSLLVSLTSVDASPTSTLMEWTFDTISGESTTKTPFETKHFRRHCDGYTKDVPQVIGVMSLSKYITSLDPADHPHTPQYMLTHETNDVSFFPSPADVMNPLPEFSTIAKNKKKTQQRSNDVYTHNIRAKDGTIETRVVNLSKPSTSYPSVAFNGNTKNQTSTWDLYGSSVVGNTKFGSPNEGENNNLANENIVLVQYPLVEDTIDSRVKVLGDDSLLVKYLNPHIVIIVTSKKSHDIAENATETGGAGSSSSMNANSEAVDPNTENYLINELYVTIVDTISGQVIYRYSIVHGESPVNAIAIENNIIVTYWNGKADRCELSSVSLFEGMIDRYGLGPFSSVPVKKDMSSFNAYPPIALQKTFILPRAVTALHHTVSARGVTNKNLLIGLNSGQIYSLDLRIIDPRRPLGAPSPAEKEEGLMSYNPYIHLIPTTMVTHNMTLPPVSSMISTPSKLESTSLILSFGIDVYFTRVTPSKGFDMLSSDFNKPLLILITISMGIVVVMLQRMHKNKLLQAGWS